MSQTELRVTLQEVSPEDYLLSCLRNYSNPLHKDGNHWYSDFLWFIWGFLAYNGMNRIAYLAQ